mmetsp:Transcript_32466/g.49679  ORF Transcript_32466/g.49679 Transcript_32466/m.49679 type:complete len:206 (-) Transcript_32466:75-692(-)
MLQGALKHGGGGITVVITPLASTCLWGLSHPAVFPAAEDMSTIVSLSAFCIVPIEMEIREHHKLKWLPLLKVVLLLLVKVSDERVVADVIRLLSQHVTHEGLCVELLPSVSVTEEEDESAEGEVGHQSLGYNRVHVVDQLLLHHRHADIRGVLLDKEGDSKEASCFGSPFVQVFNQDERVQRPQDPGDRKTSRTSRLVEHPFDDL